MNTDKEDFLAEQSLSSELNFIEEGKPQETDNSYKPEAQQEQERRKQQTLLQQIHSQFHVVENHFYFKDQPQQIAFVDDKKRIVSTFSDEYVVQAMITMAQIKDWKNIKVSGHLDFQRKVWLEASKRGIEVYGYKPTEQELEELSKSRNFTPQNIVEEVKHSEHNISHKSLDDHDINSPSSNISQGSIEDNNVNLALSSQKTEQTAEKVYRGRILTHGHDKFKHDENNAKSYYVKLATDKGEKTIWGIDLARAIAEGNVKEGDDIALKSTGSQEVKVAIPILDKEGKITDHQWVDTKRHTWDVSRSDAVRTIKEVTANVIDAYIKNSQHREVLKEAVEERLLQQEHTTGKVPTVSIYDKGSPSKESIQEKLTPKVEHTPEHTR